MSFVHIRLCAGNVEIPAHDQRAPGGGQVSGPRGHALEEDELAWVVAVAVGNVDREQREIAEVGDDRACLYIERWMTECGSAPLAPEVHAHAGVPAGRAVPVVVIRGQTGQRLGDLGR